MNKLEKLIADPKTYPNVLAAADSIFRERFYGGLNDKEFYFGDDDNIGTVDDFTVTSVSTDPALDSPKPLTAVIEVEMTNGNGELRIPVRVFEREMRAVEVQGDDEASLVDRLRVAFESKFLAPKQTPRF